MRSSGSFKVLRQAIRHSKRRSLVMAADPVLLLGDVLFYVTPLDPRPGICEPALPV
jgi:hypothetical protein